MTQPDKIDKILNSTCLYFGLKKCDLKKRRFRSHVQQHTRFLIPLLYDNTNLTFKEIGDILGCGHSNVIHHYRKVNEEVSDDVFGDKKSKRTYKELTEFIGL